MKKNILEWSVFGLGLLLVAGLIGYLGFLAFSGGHDLPELRVGLGKPERLKQGYRTKLTVENVGDETAIGVKVASGEDEIDFDYVPRHSTREGYLFTDVPPKEAHAVSAQSP